MFFSSVYISSRLENVSDPTEDFTVRGSDASEQERKETVLSQEEQCLVYMRHQ